MSIKATQPEDSAVTDEQILALNADERFFSESPTKYPESGHGTQYHAGAPGVIGFARAVLALATPSPQPAEAVQAEPTAKEFVDLQWKFECFIDFATGGKLSKSSWALETLKAAAMEHINAIADEHASELQAEPAEAKTAAVDGSAQRAISVLKSLKFDKSYGCLKQRTRDEIDAAIATQEGGQP